MRNTYDNLYQSVSQARESGETLSEQKSQNYVSGDNIMLEFNALKGKLKSQRLSDILQMKLAPYEDGIFDKNVTMTDLVGDGDASFKLRIKFRKDKHP